MIIFEEFVKMHKKTKLQVFSMVFCNFEIRENLEFVKIENS